MASGSISMGSPSLCWILLLLPNVRCAWNFSPITPSRSLDSNSTVLISASSKPGNVDIFAVEHHPKKRKSTPGWSNMAAQLDAVASQRASSPCRKDVAAFVTALQSNEMWALSMLDSFGKPPSGVLKGNVWWAGSTSQCLSGQGAPSGTSSAAAFGRRYCWVKFQPGDAVVHALQASSSPTFGLAVCMPDTCDQPEIYDIINNVLEKDHSISYDRYIRITDVLCLETLKTPWTDWKIIRRILFIAILSLFLIMGTIYDVILKSKKGSELIPTSGVQQGTNSNSWAKFLGAFSIISNAKRVLQIESAPGALQAIAAIRVLALLRIITSHTYFIAIFLAGNPVDITRLATVYFSEFLAQVSLPVDVFFLISGLLVSYSFLNECERTGGRTSWLKFYIHRYIRITPAYFFMAWFMYGALGSYLTSGALSFKLRYYYTTCENYLWRNMLYINNFFPSDEMCFGHGWYLTVDMQMFLIMPLILLPLAKSKVRLAWSITGVGVAAAASVVAYRVYALNAPLTDNLATPFSLGNRYGELFDELYAKPFIHLGVYMVGVICGWLLQKSKLQVKLTKIRVIVGWTTCSLILLGVLFVVDIPEPVDMVWRIAYNSLGRTVFAMAVAWVIFACACGYGGFINTFLSHRFWTPLSRLTYCTYICHIGILFATVGLTEVPFALSHFSVLHLLVGQLVCVFGFGFVLVLVCEEPVNQLEQIFIFPKKPTFSKHVKKEKQNNVL